MAELESRNESETAEAREDAVPDVEVCSESAEDDLSADNEERNGTETDAVIKEEGKVKKSKIEGLYRPPTHDELQALKETQNLFKSNLMKLQVRLCTFNKNF